MSEALGKGYSEIDSADSEGKKKKEGRGAIAFNGIVMLVLLVVFALASVALAAIFMRLMLGFFGISPVSKEFVAGWGTTGLGLLSAATVVAIRTWGHIRQRWRAE